MTEGRRTTRRRFLALGGLSLATVAAVGGIRLLGGGPTEALTRHIGTRFDSDGLRAIGEAYIRARPREDDEAALVRSLAARREWRSVDAPSDVARAVERTSRDDFRAGRMVQVRGWYLSEAEVRACALATFA